MGGRDSQFDRGAFLVDAGRTLAAMDNLTGGKADRVQILRAMELAREDT
jgi:hypothetical protein